MFTFIYVKVEFGNLGNYVTKEYVYVYMYIHAYFEKIKKKILSGPLPWCLCPCLASNISGSERPTGHHDKSLDSVHPGEENDI